ncbi:MAG: hypothetical protein E7190_12745 [Erysipelotrichaceae bacterium]|nr:hypothetical protein [Erysipelotrichaceae bacterium]
MKSFYSLKEDGFQAYWFEGTVHKDKAIIWMHGSGMNEKHCIADSEYIRKAGYSVLVLGFYLWKGMPKQMRGIPVEYVMKAAAELKKNGYKKIGIHGISSGAAYALLCASLIPEISLVLSICPFDYVMEEPVIFRKPTGRSWFSLEGRDYPCSLFTSQRRDGFFRSLLAYKKQDYEHHNEYLRSFYENAELREESRIKVENMKADVLLIAPERDSQWPSPDAVRRMRKVLENAGYPYRMRTVIYPHASHLLGTYPPESWKKAFPAEKKWPEECNQSRIDCFGEEMRFLEEWK